MFQCGFYEKEITPPLGCFLPGYFSLRVGGDVKDRLYARAMVIKNEEKMVAIISIDGCTFEKEVRDMVTERIKEYIGLEAENVLMGYIHTHTGIPRVHYSGDKKAEKNQESYWQVFGKLIADCAILAYYRLEESLLLYGKGEANGISFCRNYFMKNSTPRTNPPRMSSDIIGPVSETDNDLPVLFVKDKAGNPRGALITFACHADCVGENVYSGDFVSEMSKQLKKTYGEDFVTVFLQGTSGNINHFDVTKENEKPDHYRMMGKVLAGEAEKTVAFAENINGDILKSKLEYITIKRRQISDEKIAKARHIIDTVKEIPGARVTADNSDPEQYNLAMSKKLIDFIDSSPEEYVLPVQFIQIGDFKLYGFPAEIFCQFGKFVKSRTDTDKCMVSALCNISNGYVPTPDLMYDTIYEARPGANLLEENAGFILAEKLIEMGK